VKERKKREHNKFYRVSRYNNHLKREQSYRFDSRKEAAKILGVSVAIVNMVVDSEELTVSDYKITTCYKEQ
jgi:hypothetical protein